MSSCEKNQNHVHEFIGSTRLAKLKDDPHNHIFAGVSEQAIPYRLSHIHVIKAKTDFSDHLHGIIAKTGPAVQVREGKHVHFVDDETTVADEHNHELIFATFIETSIL